MAAASLRCIALTPVDLIGVLVAAAIARAWLCSSAVNSLTSTLSR